MSDKDDMFGSDDEFDAMSDDDLFGDSESDEPETVAEAPAKAKKITIPSSAPVVASEPVEEEVEEDDDTVEAQVASDNEEEEEAQAEAPVEVKAPKEKKPKKEKAPTHKKLAHKPLTAKEKVVNNIYRKAGLDGTPPTLDSILRGKQGTKMKLSDIAVFIDTPENEVLADLHKKMPVLNRVNLSACVDLNLVKRNGGDILKAGRMYQPIQVARIEEDGRYECTSGRHRVVFLALVYGPDAEIPVYIEDMSLNEARDAVVVANESRNAKAMEKAEHAVLSAVGGDIDAKRDEMYQKTSKNKSGALKYGVYSVFHQGNPAKFDFAITNNSTRKNGELTTISCVESYWSAALVWNKGMSRKDFDSQLKASVVFLNAVAKAFEANPSFEASQHMANMTLSAIGKYYKTLVDVGVEPEEKVDKLTNVLVAMGEIGRTKSNETYEAIVDSMKK